MEQVWEQIRYYARLSEESKLAWEKIMIRKEYKKDQYFIIKGEVPLTMAFVTQGLFSQFYISERDELKIERFFPEKYIMAADADVIRSTPSKTSIKALEDSVIWEFHYNDFQRIMMSKHYDICKFYSVFLARDMGREDKRYFINIKDDTARLAYINFKKDYPSLESRLKPQEVAAYLGILPDHLRILRDELN